MHDILHQLQKTASEAAVVLSSSRGDIGGRLSALYPAVKIHVVQLCLFMDSIGLLDFLC